MEYFTGYLLFIMTKWLIPHNDIYDDDREYFRSWSNVLIYIAQKVKHTWITQTSNINCSFWGYTLIHNKEAAPIHVVWNVFFFFIYWQIRFKINHIISLRLSTDTHGQVGLLVTILHSSFFNRNIPLTNRLFDSFTEDPSNNDCERGVCSCDRAVAYCFRANEASFNPSYERYNKNTC